MKTLLILTGHSKGLGKAILDKYWNEKDVQIIGISRSLLEIQKEGFSEVSLDLNDVDTLTESIAGIFPKGDYQKVILINNAGWIGEIKPVGKLEPLAIQKAITVNLIAPMILMDAFVKRYSQVTCEKIILNISSGAAYKPLPGWGEYCSSKAGLAMFSNIAAEELAPKGFRVFSLAPGIVDTGMQGEIREAVKEDFPALDRFVTYKADGQLSTPDTVAQKIWYLLSNPSLFQEVNLDVRNFEIS